jgi:hypothetical protein
MVWGIKMVLLGGGEGLPLGFRQMPKGDLWQNYSHLKGVVTKNCPGLAIDALANAVL